MASLDEIFYKEFMNMLSKRKSMSPVLDLNKLILPPNIGSISNYDKVYIRGIQDDYYSKLNNTEAILLSRPNLRRRKFDYKGELIRKNDDYVYEEVDIPNTCVAIVSNIRLGVPLKHKPSEKFIYVDAIEKESDGKKDIRYIYILPRIYCFKLNQVALVLSLNRIRNYYNGMSIALLLQYVSYQMV